MAISDSAWDGDSGRFTIEQWRRSCLINHGGDEASKSNFSLPVREPDGRLNRHGLAAAAGRLNQVQGITAEARAAAARKLIALYHEANMTPPDHLRELAGHSAPTDDDSVESLERCWTGGVVEVRSGSGQRRIGGLASVFGQRSRKMSFGYEMVDRGFFNASRDAAWPNVVARWDHDSSRLLGSTYAGTLRLWVDTRGLSYDVDLPECRSDLYELVARRDVAQSSFCFAEAEDTWSYADGHPLRTLITGRLIDVAPVGEIAAYPGASVALRSLARFVDAPIEDVEMYCSTGELRKFFQRSDQPSRGVPMTYSDTRPAWQIQQEHMQRILELHAKRMAWDERELAELRAMRS